MTDNMITQEEEFFSAEKNYLLVCAEFRQKIIGLQNDLDVITDPEVKGFAQNRYLQLRKEYFELLKIDIDTQINLENRDSFQKIEKNLTNNEVI